MKLRKDIVNRVKKEGIVDTKKYRYYLSDTPYSGMIVKYRFCDLDTIGAYENAIYYDLDGNEIFRRGNVW